MRWLIQLLFWTKPVYLYAYSRSLSICSYRAWYYYLPLIWGRVHYRLSVVCSSRVLSRYLPLTWGRIPLCTSCGGVSSYWLINVQISICRRPGVNRSYFRLPCYPLGTNVRNKSPTRENSKRRPLSRKYLGLSSTSITVEKKLPRGARE